MPTINKRLLLRLFLLTLVLGGGLFLLNYVQSDRVTDALRWQAERSAENGRNDKAIYYMKQYLELRPGDHDAAVKLGDLILARGGGRKDLANVLFLYERVLREGPRRDDVRRKLVDICLQLGRFSDASIHARALLDESPRDGELWEALAIAQASQNRNEEARASLTSAIDCDATRVRSYELLAELLARQMHQPDAARVWIEKMVAANPETAEAYLARARFERGLNKQADCLPDVERLLQLDPKNADGLLMLAELMQARDEPAKARTALTAGVAAHPRDARFYRALSSLELASGNAPAAVAALDRGCRNLPGAVELLLPLGDLLVQQGEIERVRDIIRRMEARGGLDIQAQYLGGRALMQEGKWSDAVAALEALRTRTVGMPGLAAEVNVLLATCQERLDNRDAQIEALRRALSFDPGHLNARLKFGALHLASGDLDEAVKEYSAAARVPDAPPAARFLLGRMMIARARAAGNSGDWNAVMELVNSLREKYKNSADPTLVAVEAYMARQQYEEARKLLRQEIARPINDPRLWSVLSAVALEEEGLPFALAVLEEGQAALGDQVELRLARARAWAVDWQPGRDERIRALARRADEFSQGDQLQLLMGLADVAATIRDFRLFAQFQKQLAERLPRDVGVRRALYVAAARIGDDDLRKAVGVEIAALAGESVAAVVNALAEIEARRDRTRQRARGSTGSVTAPPAPIDPGLGAPIAQEQRDEWNKLARDILTASPGRADAHFLLAKLADLAGDASEASREYARTVALDPTHYSYLEGQLAFLIRHDEDALAKKRVEQCRDDPRLGGDALLGILEGACGRFTPDRMTRSLAWLEPVFKSSGVSLLWLARSQQSLGYVEPAQAIARRTTTAQPKFVDAWVARMRLQPETAHETLKAARAVLDDRAWFVLCAETVDLLRRQQSDWLPEFEKPEEARSFAQACLRSFLLRDKTAEATAAVNRLAADPQARPEDVAWAKRTAALLAASRGGAGEIRQVVLTLKDMKPEPGSSLEDLRSLSASLTLASRHAHGQERKDLLRQGVAAMKRVTADKQATARDWHRLAQLYRQVGDREAGDQAIKEAMRRDETNLFYVSAYVNDLLKDGRLTDAEPYLPRLLQATHDVRAVATAAKFHALSNQPARAIEIVDKYAQSPGGPGRVRQAADMLDQAGRAAAAKNLSGARVLIETALERYRSVLQFIPETAGPLTALLAFDGRTSAALDLLASLRAALPAKALTTYAVAVLRAGAATPRQFQQVRGWIDAALVEQPTLATLKLNLAELLALRQEYPAAEPLYREVLVTEPDNVVALNNLAWILSPRSEAADEATKCVERAIDLSGASGELLDTRARIAISRGNFERAIDDLNEALEYSQTSLRYFHLALAQFKQLKKNESVQSFKEAKSRGLDPKMVHPSDMPTYKALAAQVGD